MRRCRPCVTVAAEVIGAQRVDEHEHDVGWSPVRLLRTRAQCERRQHASCDRRGAEQSGFPAGVRAQSVESPASFAISASTSWQRRTALRSSGSAAAISSRAAAVHCACTPRWKAAATGGRTARCRSDHIDVAAARRLGWFRARLQHVDVEARLRIHVHRDAGRVSRLLDHAAPSGIALDHAENDLDRARGGG